MYIFRISNKKLDFGVRFMTISRFKKKLPLFPNILEMQAKI